MNVYDLDRWADDGGACHDADGLTLIPYETLLDASRRHFEHVAASPNWTREAREKALHLARTVACELASFNAGHPARRLQEAS